MKKGKEKGGSNKLVVMSYKGDPGIRFSRVEVHHPNGTESMLWPKGETWYISTGIGNERVLHISRPLPKAIASNPLKFGLVSGAATTVAFAGLFQFIF